LQRASQPMNGILYFLTGCGIAGAMVAAFFAHVDVGRSSLTDIAASWLFVLLLAAGFLFLVCTSWGRRLKMWLDKKEADADDRVRTTPGKVREPPLGPLP
jgi:hypothetical protein